MKQISFSECIPNFLLYECFTMHMMTCQVLVLGQNTRGVTLADDVKKKKISDNDRDLKADRIYMVELLILVRSKRTDSWRHMCLSEF